MSDASLCALPTGAAVRLRSHSFSAIPYGGGAKGAVKEVWMVSRRPICSTTAFPAPAVLCLLAAPALGTSAAADTDLSIAFAEAQAGYLAYPVGALGTAVLQDQEPPAEDATGEEKEEGLPWKAAIDFALTSVTGNTEEQTMRFGFNGGYETEKTRLTIDASYYLKVSRGTTTDNKFTAGSRHDWLWPDSRWFWFVGGRLDYDQFESWETRMNFQGGPGYQLLKKEDNDLNMTLDVYGGIGARKEWGSLNDEWKPEGLLAIDYTYFITERMRFDIDAAFFPAFEDFKDYRFRSTATWRYALTEEQNLSLVIGYLLEYQSIADPGKETTDFRLWIGIQYAFF
ncbi:MAG: DUF481 domain-containing protein [Planctomycetota bacterium]|jgi:putative salt-induced outer membrane protein YdiY